MSNILTFTVKPESQFYADYFEAKSEKKRFRDRAIPFLLKYGIEGKCYMANFLALVPTDRDIKMYGNQILKTQDRNGITRFKRNSPVEKAWESEVAAHANFPVLEKCDLWYIEFITSGKYKLWDWNGTIYGYLENKYDRDIIPNERWMYPIKVSEYYSAVEAYEDKINGKENDDCNS